MTNKGCIVIFLSLLILVVGVIIYAKYSTYPIEYDGIVSKYAEEYDIEKSLIFAIIKVESNFMERAESSVGARGLMQIMENTAKWMNVGGKNINLYDPIDNIKIGTKYLHYLLGKYENKLIATLAAYNAGEGNVSEWISRKSAQNNDKSSQSLNILTMEDIEYEETRNYVNNVIKIKHYYEILYNLE